MFDVLKRIILFIYLPMMLIMGMFSYVFTPEFQYVDFSFAFTCPRGEYTECFKNEIGKKKDDVIFETRGFNNRAERFSSFLKLLIDFEDFLRFDVGFKNISHYRLEVTYPSYKKEPPLIVSCVLFDKREKDINFSEILTLWQGIKLGNLEEKSEEIIDFLQGCLPASQRFSLNDDIIVGPLETISVSINLKYQPLVRLDKLSTIFFLFSSFLITLGFLPIVISLVKFLQDGLKKYKKLY